MPRGMEPSGLLLPEASATDRAYWLKMRHVDADRTLLTLTTLIDEHLIDTASSPLRFVREDALTGLRAVIPFIDEHAIWLDSPHDGLAPQALNGNAELSCSEPWARGPHTMRAVR